MKQILSLALFALLFAIGYALPSERRHLSASTNKPINPCLITSKVIISAFNNLSVASCTQLYQGKQGVMLPSDTSNIMYGGLSIEAGGFSPPSATFFDRNSFIPKPYFVSLGQSLSQMLWQAQFTKGDLTNLTLVLFVDRAHSP